MWVLILIGASMVALCELVYGRGRSRATALGVLFACGAGLALLLPGSFVHQKVVGRLLMPLGLVTLILAFGTCLAARAGHWRLAVARGFALAVVVLSGSTQMGAALVKTLEDTVPPDPGSDFDAVLVLGGGTSLSPLGQAELGPSGDRLRLGAALFHRARTRWLVASGKNPVRGRERDLSKETSDLWEEMGVDPNRVLHLPDPVNTSEEIAAFAALCRDRGFERVAVVSSAFHLPRASALLARHQLRATLLAAHHRVGPPAPPSVLDWIPTATGLRLTEIWAWERLGRMLGR